MKTKLEKALLKTKKEINDIFISLIDSYKLHIKYLQDNKTDTKQIKDNIKQANKFRVSAYNNMLRVLALYAPTSTMLMQTSIYMQVNINLAEIIRKTKEMLNESKDGFDTIKVDKKEIISVELSTIKIFEKTSFMITHLLDKEKIITYHKEISKDIKDNEKKCKEMQSHIAKSLEKDKASASYLKAIFYLKSLLDIENQCLYITSNINKNSYRL